MDRLPEARSPELETWSRSSDPRRSAAAIRRVLEPAARLCAAARVLVRHKGSGRIDYERVAGRVEVPRRD